MMRLLPLLVLLVGCTSIERKSDLPLTQICFLAQCSVNATERGAAQDSLEDSEIEAEFSENTDQKSESKSELELTP